VYRPLAIGLVAMIAFIALGLYGLTVRMHYYDYAATTCMSDSVQVDAVMIGSFGRDPPNVRGAPYYLQMHAIYGGNIVALKTIRLRSISSGTNYDFSEAIRPSLVKDVFVVNPIIVPYDDYEMFAEMRVQNNFSTPIQFHCTFKKKYSEEIRIPWLDRLMSV
jgi:hypothetical protein